MEIQKGGTNNSDFLQNWFPPGIRSPPPLPLNLQKFDNCEKSTPESYRMYSKLMNDEEFGSKKLLKQQYRRGGSNNSDILQNWFPPPEIRSPAPPYFLEIFQNDKDFTSRKLLKLKYRKGDQITQTFCNIGCPQKLDPPSLICRNLKTLRKVLLNDGECIEI